MKWHHNDDVHEGWIYFKDDEYLTIEIFVKNKPDDLVKMHRKVHCLIVCHKWYWNELNYVNNRRGDE